MLTGIVYSLLPYGGHPTGWTNPWVLFGVFGGIAVLVLFVWIETSRAGADVPHEPVQGPRLHVPATSPGLLAASGRGGLQFMLIIWLQGIWLPQHGYSFSQTPLWAGIYMIPSHCRLPPCRSGLGHPLRPLRRPALRDRRAIDLRSEFLVVGAAADELPLPVWFALLVFMFAVGMGLFFSPNQSAVMNSLPPEQRGAGAGMLNTFQNSATVLSMGLFFTIVTLGLAADLPKHLYRGLVAAGVASAPAHVVASEPPIGSLFSAFLGFNPVKELLGPTGALRHLSAHQAAYVTGRSFFPSLIEQPFANGLHLAFDFAAGATLIGVVASALRGRQYVHAARTISDELAEGAADTASVSAFAGGSPFEVAPDEMLSAPAGERE